MGLFTGGASALYLWLAGGLLVGGLLFGVKHYYNAYHDEVTAYAVLQSKNSELVDVIKADKVAVDKLAADSQARAAVAAAAITKAQQAAKDLQKKANIILMTPQVDKDACVSANILFDDFIKGAK